MPDLIKKRNEERPYLAALEERIITRNHAAEREYEEQQQANRYSAGQAQAAPSVGPNTLTPAAQAEFMRRSGANPAPTAYQQYMMGVVNSMPRQEETRSNDELEENANRLRSLATTTERERTRQGLRLTQNPGLLYDRGFSWNLRNLQDTAEATRAQASAADTYAQSVIAQRNEEKYQSYLRLMQNPDFAANSRMDPKIAEDDSLFRSTATEHYKAIYNRKAEQARAKRGGEDSGGVLDASFVTDDEAAVYTYLWNTQGAKAAEAYYNDYLKNRVSSRAADLERTQNLQAAKDNPVAANLYTVAANQFSGLGMLDLTAQYMARRFGLASRNAPINYNTPLTRISAGVEDIRGETARMLEERYPDANMKLIGNTVNLASFLYQTGMSMADSAVGQALTLIGIPESATLSAMAGAAGMAAIRDARERGASDGEALLFGWSSALAEAAFEKISLDIGVSNFKAQFDPDNFKTIGRVLMDRHGIKDRSGLVSWLLTNVITGGTEGSEEAMTTLANTLADALIMGDRSELETRKRALLEQGVSDSEASKAAWKNWLSEITGDTLGGFLSGGIMSGGQQLGGLTARAAGGVRNAAQDFQLAREITDAQRAPQATPDAPLTIPETPQQQQARPQTVREQDPLGFALNKAQSGETVTGQDAKAIMNDPQALQSLRESGVLSENIRPGAEGRTQIQQAVQALAAQNAQQETAGQPRAAQERQERVETPPMPQRAQEAAERPTELRIPPVPQRARQDSGLTLPTGNATLNENRQEDLNNGQGQQAETAASAAQDDFRDRAGRAAEGARRSYLDRIERSTGVGRLLSDLRNYRTVRSVRDRAGEVSRIRNQAEAGNQRGVSARDYGIAGGTAEQSAMELDSATASRVLGRNWDRAVSELAREGVTLKAMTGQLKKEDGSQVRAFFSGDGKTIVVQVDHPKLSWNQLLGHEDLHRRIKADKNYRKAVEDALLADKKLQAYLPEIIDRYAQAYAREAPGLSSDDVIEELLADYRAGFDMLDPLGMNPITARAAKRAAKDIRALERKGVKQTGENQHGQHTTYSEDGTKATVDDVAVASNIVDTITEDPRPFDYMSADKNSIETFPDWAQKQAQVLEESQQEGKASTEIETPVSQEIAERDVQEMEENPDTFIDSSIGEKVKFSYDIKAEQDFEPLRDEDGNIKYVYKAFYVMKDENGVGRLYPPMVANISDEKKKTVKGAVSGTQKSIYTPLGIVLTADVGSLGRYTNDETEYDVAFANAWSGKSKAIKQIKEDLKNEGFPATAKGVLQPKKFTAEQTEELERRMAEAFPAVAKARKDVIAHKSGELIRNETGRLAVQNAKGGGTLAFRPGWHLGEWPDAKQFNKDHPVYGERSVMPDQLVFARCEIAGAVDYQLDAMRSGVNAQGKFERSQAGLPRVPTNGYYKYRTNPDPYTAPWYITGQMRVVEILTDEQCREICEQYGVDMSPRESGHDIDLEAYGLKAGPVERETNTDRFLKSEKGKANERELEAALADPAYADAYKPGNIDFNDPAIQKEFGINRQDAEYYRKQYDERFGGSASIEIDPDVAKQFSMEGIEERQVQSLLRENEELKKKLKDAKAQIKTSDRTQPMEEDVRRMVRDLLKAYSSKADGNQVNDSLRELAHTIMSNDARWTDIRDQAVRLAGKILEESSVLVGDDAALNREIRNAIRKEKIAYTNKGDISDYGQWRKDNFGKLKIAKDGVPIDSRWEELQDTYGKGYFPDDIKNPADQIVYLSELYDRLQDVYENPYNQNMAEATEFLANDIIDRVISGEMRQAPTTYADRAETRLARETLRGELREQKIKERLEEERERRREQIAELKEHYKGKEAKGRENRKAKELRTKIIDHAKQMTTELLKPTDKKHVPESLRKSVAAVLSAIDLGSGYDMTAGQNGNTLRVGRGTEGAEQTKRTKAFLELKEALLKEADGLVLDPELLGTVEEPGNLTRLITELADVPIANMNTEQLQVVYDALRGIEGAVKSANRMLSQARWAAVSEAADAIRSENSSKGPVLQLAGPAGRVQDLTRLDMLTPEGYFHRLGKSGQAVFKLLRSAQDKFITNMTQATEATRKIVGDEDVGALEKETHTLTMGGEQVTMTTAQIMELYCLMQRDQGLQHITTGGVLIEPVRKGIKQETQVEPLHPSMEELLNAVRLLTPDEVKMADALQKYLSEDLAELGNEATLNVYGYKKFGQEAKYWKIRSNKNEIQQSIEKETQTTSVANRGFTKAINPQANTSIKVGSIFDTYSQSVNDMATYAAWLDVGEDVNRIRNYVFRDSEGQRTGTVKGVLDRVIGTGGANYLQRLLADIANGAGMDDAGLTSGFVGAYKAAAIGANIRVIAQQPTAILRAAEMIDPKYLAVGLKNPMKAFERAKEYSPIAQWKDWGYFDINTGRKMKDVLFESSSKLEKVRQASMAMAGKADSFAWGQLWGAVEAETKDKTDLKPGTKEFYQACAERFNDIIDHTQVVDGILQRSQIMRSKNAITRMAVSFMSEPTKQYNQFMSAVYDYRHSEDKKQAKQMLARTTFSMVAAGILNVMAQSLVDGLRDDDREKKYWEKVLQAFLGYNPDDNTFGEKFKTFAFSNMGEFINPASYLPYAKDIMSIIQGYSVDRMDMDAISDTITAMTRLYKAMNGEGKQSAGYSLVKAMEQGAKLLGLSVYNIDRDLTALFTTIANDADIPVLQYYLNRYRYKPTENLSKDLKGILWDARQKNDGSYDVIVNRLLKDGYTQEGIDKAMMNRLSDESGFTEARKAADAEGNNNGSYDLGETLAALDSIEVSEEDRDILLEAKLSEKQYANYTTLLQYSDYDTWLSVMREMPANLSQAKIEAVLDKRDDLTTKQKAAYWQVLSGATSTKNNPYSQEVGTEILNAKAENQPDKEPEKVAQMRSTLSGLGVPDSKVDALAPVLGGDGTNTSKWRAVANQNLGTDQQDAVLKSIMTDSMYRNWTIASGENISLDSYVKGREAYVDLDDSGTDQNSEWTAALEKVTFDKDTTRNNYIKGVLWQIYTGSTSTKNNPFDKTGGQKVLDAKGKGGGKGTGSNAPARIPTLRIPEVPKATKPSSGLRIRAATPAAQAPRNGLRIKAQ